ncbi:MAG: HD domain-containing protein [archaeon]
MLKLEDISIGKLRSGKLIKELPEIYELKKIIEINPWHDHDSVFDHTLSVMKNLSLVEKKLGKKGKALLGRKIGPHSRKGLLFLAATLHDIAKGETLRIHVGLTSCKGHDILGAEKAKKMLNRFNLSAKEKAFIVGIIRMHHLVHNIFDESDDIPRSFREFKDSHSDLFLELTMLGYADTLGCKPEKSVLENLRLRFKFYKGMLKEY